MCASAADDLGKTTQSNSAFTMRIKYGILLVSKRLLTNLACIFSLLTNNV